MILDVVSTFFIFSDDSSLFFVEQPEIIIDIIKIDANKTYHYDIVFHQ